MNRRPDAWLGGSVVVVGKLVASALSAQVLLDGALIEARDAPEPQFLEEIIMFHEAFKRFKSCYLQHMRRCSRVYYPLTLKDDLLRSWLAPAEATPTVSGGDWRKQKPTFDSKSVGRLHRAH